MTTIERPKISRTEEVIAEMLTENTGCHFLDSGGSSGRAWQRNCAAVEAAQLTPAEFFKTQPKSYFGWPRVHPHPNHRKPDDKLTAELWVTHDVFHWLSAAVEYDDEIDRLFDIFAGLSDEDAYWMQLSEEFPEWYSQLLARVKAMDEEDGDDSGADDYYQAPGGIYGDSSGPILEYTYNVENCLSQDIQFVYWTIDGDEFALVQIHNGADARGGLTKPRGFRTAIDSDPPGFFDFHRFGIGCDKCCAMWSGDESCGYQNGADYRELPSLDEYEAMESTDETDAVWRAFHTGLLAEWCGERGKIVIEKRGQYPTDDTSVYCPECGIGELSPYFY